MSFIRSRLSKCITLFIFVTIFCLGFYGNISSDGAKVAVIAKVDGIINPVTERHVKNIIDDAEDKSAELVVILLDTPGGHLSREGPEGRLPASGVTGSGSVSIGVRCLSGAQSLAANCL